VVVTAAKQGRSLDGPAFVRLLETGTNVVDAPFRTIAPAISDAAARKAAAAARALIGSRIAIDYHGARRGGLTPVQLGRALRFRPHPHKLSVVLDGQALADTLRPR